MEKLVFLSMNLSPKNYAVLYAIIVFVLIGLQGYYIFNSFQLEEKELKSDAVKIATTILAEMDNLEDESEEDLIKNFKKMSHINNEQFGELNVIKSEVNLRFKKLSEKLDALLLKASSDYGYEIALEKKVNSIYDEINSKEILGDKPLLIYQSSAKIVEPKTINEGIWATNDLSNETDTDLGINNKEEHKYRIKSSVDFELKNVRFLVFKKIIPLIVVSLIILFFLIYLYIQTLKNVHRQETVNKQLYLTIDSIAHELNTPITTLKFAAQQIDKSETKSIVLRQINRLEKSVQAIFQEQNSKEYLVQKKHIDDYIVELKNQYSNVQLLSSINFDANNYLTKNDFELILNNLIENAAKYGARSIKVDLNFSQSIKITVIDDGIGIPTEDLENIFHKYYRVNREINLKISGVGLGLYLVKKCIEKYNGNILVVNQKSKGVKFEISIPNEK